MTPKTISYDLGCTAYGQPLSLTLSRDTAGCYVWTLRRDQADQRDDSAVISGLSNQTILDMAECVKKARD